MEETYVESTDDGLFLAVDDDENVQDNKYLLFNLGGEVYGISIAHVTEIIEIQSITAVPDITGYLKGVINLRGRIIPVMDLRLRFGMDGREFDDRTCIVIVNINDKSLGMIVDTVAEVQDIVADNIEPPPSFKSDSTGNDFIQGLGKIEDRVVILIDVERITNGQDLEISGEE